MIKFTSKVYLLFPFFFCACTATTPKNINNICQLFEEKDDWYHEAKEASDKWAIPIPVLLSIMHQESRFVADAKPPRPYLLGFVPWFRNSSAYGYAQAQNGSWQDYIKHSSSRWGADRDDFADACDFIGWYCTISHNKLGISKQQTANLYLAYHEGHGGYSRKTYLKKPWLLKVAKKVAKKSKQYQSQLSTCEDELDSKSSFFW